MVVSFLLLLVSGSLAGYGLIRPDVVPQGMMIFALFGAAVALVQLLLAGLHAPSRRKPHAETLPTAPPPDRDAGLARKNWLVIDGSNVMHWQDDQPQLAPLLAVIAKVTALGFEPGVIFDANVGYKLGGRYQDDADLARRLGLPVDRVLVVPKGVQADPYLLQSARDLGARVISQDRFRDRAEEFPEVSKPGFLIRGGYRDGVLWLDEIHPPPPPNRAP